MENENKCKHKYEIIQKIRLGEYDLGFNYKSTLYVNRCKECGDMKNHYTNGIWSGVHPDDKDKL